MSFKVSKHHFTKKKESKQTPCEQLIETHQKFDDDALSIVNNTSKMQRSELQ